MEGEEGGKVGRKRGREEEEDAKSWRSPRKNESGSKRKQKMFVLL